MSWFKKKGGGSPPPPASVAVIAPPPKKREVDIEKVSGLDWTIRAEKINDGQWSIDRGDLPILMQQEMRNLQIEHNQKLDKIQAQLTALNELLAAYLRANEAGKIVVEE